MDTLYPQDTIPVSRFILWAVALLGFCSTMTQVIVLREMMNIFSGNEFIASIVLSSWMLLTGAGASYGVHFHNQQFQLKKEIQYILWLGILPVLTIITLYGSKYLLFPPGVLIDVQVIFPMILLLLAPYCLLSGHLFACFIVLAQRRYHFRADRLYAIETAGSVAGGILVGGIILFCFSTIESLMVVWVINIFVAYLLDNKNRFGYIILVFAAIVLAVLPSDVWLKKLVFPNLQIVESRETPYGNVTITKSANQLSVFANHNLLYTTQNTIDNEETVHFTMLQHPAPQNVLLISGGTGGIISEILKYKTLHHVDYVEENPWLLSIVRKVDPLPSDSRLSVELSDVRKFLANDTQVAYDVVIIAVPEPSTLQSNRYFTIDFFRLLKSRLHKNAVIGLSLPSSGYYYSPQNLRMQSLIFNTLKQVFPFVLFIPDGKDFVLASNQSLSMKIGALSKIRGIETSYVNSFYIDDLTLIRQIKLLNSSLAPGPDINFDFQPLAVYYSNNRHLSMFSNSALILILPLFILLWPVFRLKQGTLVLYVSGFSISALEIFLLLSFQIVFGFVYAASGIIISCCMGGLAIGSIAGWRLNWQASRLFLVINQLLIGLTAGLFIGLISKVGIVGNRIFLYSLFFLASLIPSIFAGLQFSQMIRIVPKHESASHLYAADLFGAALGAILVPIVLLPVLGITFSLLIVVGINLIAVVFLLIPKQ